MSLSKEHLLTINGLKLSGIIEGMDNQQFDDYCKMLFAFTESFPVQEAELKKFFNARDYDSFSKVLISVREVLIKIQAVGLVQGGLRLLDEFKAKKYQIAEAHLAYFLAEITEISIDIQMAQQKFSPKIEKSVEVVATDTKKIIVHEVVKVEKPKSILAVDDVSLTLNSLRLALQDTRYKLTGVRSGADALKFIQENTPDLYILDIEMPEMNGYELAKKIRSCGKIAPIIFLTGNAKQEYVIKAIEAGGVDFIVKPVNKDNVIERINRYIDY